MTKISKHNLPFLMIAILGLISALFSGLMRAGWQIPVLNLNFSLLHGPLMVGGFLGTVISLERAVALNKRWSYLAPLFTALGIIFIWLEPLNFLAPWLILPGSMILVLIFTQFQKIKNSFDIILMQVAAIVWMISNALWISGWPVSVLSIWWIVFLLLTITAERLQLSGMLQISKGRKAGYTAGFILSLFSLIVTFFSVQHAWHLLALSLLIFATWLLMYDIARKTIRRQGLTKFIAANLISGYAWLLVAAILILFRTPHTGGLIYDAVLHSIFVGFVFSMIFGHAPIIFPAIIGSPINYHQRFYIHFAVLHVSLIFRVGADLSGWMDGRSWASLFNVIAVLIFLINTVFSVINNFFKKQQSND